MSIIDLIAVFVSAIISSMGLGGGGILILYLSLFKNIEQLPAQGTNLLFFIPCAVTALCIYIKEKLIKFKIILPIVLGGLAGVLSGYFLLRYLNPVYIRKAFAVMLILSGIISLFNVKKQKNKSIVTNKNI